MERRIKPRKFDLNPDEFLAAISGELTPAELGVYWMICLLQYSRRGPIKYDMKWLRGKFKNNNHLWVVEPAVRKLIATGRLVQDGDDLWSSRTLEETEKAINRVRNAIEHGGQGGRPPDRVTTQSRRGDDAVPTESRRGDDAVPTELRRSPVLVSSNTNGLEKGSGFGNQKLTSTSTTTSIKEEEESKKETPSGVSKEKPRRESEQARLIRLSEWRPNAKHHQKSGELGHEMVWLSQQEELYRLQQPNAKFKHKDFDAGFMSWIMRADAFAETNRGYPNGREHSYRQPNIFQVASGVAGAIQKRRENSTDNLSLDDPVLDTQPDF